MLIRLIVFLIINFGGLALAGLSTSDAVTGDWYLSLNKAPWTPPGWVFGVAWSTIMICFSIYLAKLWGELEDKQSLLLLLVPAIVLNIAWSPVFFSWQWVAFGLLIMLGLTTVVWMLFFKYRTMLGSVSYLLLPYMIWAVIATSLNAYILIFN